VFGNSQDLIKILMIHAKMPSLRDAAGDTHVEVNSGGAAVIARAVQTATNPTEGRRLLQTGFEKISASSDVVGMVRVDRVAERSVVSDNEPAVLVQQSAQQVSPTPGIKMAIKTNLTTDTDNLGGAAVISSAVPGAPSTPQVLFVPSKNFSMYGKHMREMHLGGFSVESDTVLRFRKRDQKVAVGDMLVGMGRYSKVSTAQELIFKMIGRKDDKINGLESLEIDMDLLELKVCT